MGVAVRLLVLLLDFFVRHLQPRLEEICLQRHINHRRQKHHQQQQAGARYQPLRHIAKGQGRGLQNQPGYAVDAVAHEVPRHKRKNGGHQHHLGHIGHLLLGEQVGCARDWIEPAELRCDGLGAENPATRTNGAEQRGATSQHGKNKAGHQAHQHHVLKAGEHAAGGHHGGGIKTQLLPHGALHVLHQLGGPHHQATRPCAQNGQVREIARAGALAVFARLLELSLGRGEAFFLAGFHGGMTAGVMPLS